MLRKQLSKFQWLALLLLFVGVSVVQLEEQMAVKNPVSSTPSPADLSANIIQKQLASTGAPLTARRAKHAFVGLMAVIVASVLSGFAGVYFEKVLKGTDDVSVWMRNVQMAMLSIPISFVTMQLKDGAALRMHGLLYGYDAWVWTVVFWYAFGGLTVAACIKYADNILKGFSTSVAIVLSSLVSMFAFNFVPSVQFVSGATMVIAATYLYSAKPYVSDKPLPLTDSKATSTGKLIELDNLSKA